MDVKQWLKSTKPEQRGPVVEEAGTTAEYLLQLAGNHRKPSVRLARRLEQASRIHTPDHVMVAEDLRPDIFKDEAAA